MISSYNAKFVDARVVNIALVFLWLMFAVLFSSIKVYASDVTDRRLQISLSIFPKIVAVDAGIRDKLDKNNKVLLAFISEFDNKKSRELSETLKSKIKNIAGMGYKTILTNFNDKLDDSSFSPTAIFLTEKLSPEKFSKVMNFANRKHILVFSPFIGDVERGATVGIAITSRVKPYFNIQTLESASIDINALLMKVSKRYE